MYDSLISNNSTSSTSIFYINWFEFSLGFLGYLGSITNIINIFVFLNKNLKDPVYDYMLAISIIDFLYITFIGSEVVYRCGSSCNFRFNYYSTQIYELVFIDYLTSSMALSTIFIELYVSMDRLLLLSNKKYLHKKSTFLILTLIIIFSLVFYLPVLFLKKISKIPEGYALILTDFGSSTFGRTIPGILSGVRLLLVLFCLSIVNALCFIQFRKHLFYKVNLKFKINFNMNATSVNVSRELSTVSNGRPRNSNQFSKSNESKIIKNITLMIISMSCLFIIGNLPWEPIEHLKNYDYVKSLGSINKNIEKVLEFSAFRKNFTLNLFKKQSNILESVNSSLDNKNIELKNFDLNYEGFLIDEPNDSFASGIILDKYFYGTIRSKRYGNFYIEPSKSLSNLEPIIYKETDVILEQNFSRTINKIKETLKLRRDAIQQKSNRLLFPNDSNVCNLNLNIDPYFYERIYKKEGHKDQNKTMSYILLMLKIQIEFLNDIFNPIEFYNYDKSGYYTGVRFIIEQLKIWTFKSCLEKALNESENSKINTFCSNTTKPLEFLTLISGQNNDDYCLAYTLTARNFPNNTIGAAWLGDYDKNYGLCGKYSTRLNLGFNTGFISIVYQNFRLPDYKINIALAHEIGHSFGADHDLEDDLICSPSLNNGGVFLMSKSLKNGRDKNNLLFSTCSINQMSKHINSIVNDSRRFCFK
ncbi:unnamed protein product, partial [Brachionus calyciflorus]